MDSQFEKSRSRVLTGEKTPNSKKNHKAFDSIKNSGGGSKAEGNLVESRWDLKVGDFEKLVESFHEVGVKVGLKKTQGVVQIQEHLIKIEAFVNCLIGMFIVFKKNQKKNGFLDYLSFFFSIFMFVKNYFYQKIAEPKPNTFSNQNGP